MKATRSLLSTALLVLIASPIAAPVHAASDTTPKVIVMTEGDQPVAEFTTAKCRKSRGSFVALTPRVNGYRMFVSIEDFSGYHTYELQRGRNADPYVSISLNGESAFSTLFVPPFPVPGYGQVRFSRKGKLMGVGFQPMFNEAGTEGVVFAGGLKCQYKKRK